MALKVDFSGDTKEIVVKPGVTEIDVKIDLYSDWKEWVLETTNAKYLDALRTFGGDPTITGQFAPSYFFLQNGWRVVVGNDEDVSFGVNLYTEEGDTPFIVGSGSSVTNRNSDAVTVDNGIAQSLDYNGTVHINSNIGVSGGAWPVGTVAQPVSNLADAKTIAAIYNISHYHIYGLINFDVDLNNSEVQGGNLTDEVVFQGVNVSGTTFREVHLEGSFFGDISADHCHLDDGLTGMGGLFKSCGVGGVLNFNNGVDSNIIDCSSQIPGNQSPSIVLGNDINLSMRKYSGGLAIYDCDTGTTVTLEFMAGNCRILSGNTGGEIEVRGITKFTDQSSGTTIGTEGLLIPTYVAQQQTVNVNQEILKNQ